MLRRFQCLKLFTTKCCQTPCIQPRILKCSYHHMRYTEVEDQWKNRDGIPKNFDLIYKAPLDNIIKYLASYLTISTSALACIGVYSSSDLYKYAASSDPIMLSDDVVLANSPNESILFFISFVGFHIAIRVLVSKYVLRIYKSGDEYIAVFRGYFHNTITKHSFKLNDFESRSSPFFVSWSDARFKLGEKNAIILENYFKTPEYFNHLLTKKALEEEDE